MEQKFPFLRPHICSYLKLSSIHHNRAKYFIKLHFFSSLKKKNLHNPQ